MLQAEGWGGTAGIGGWGAAEAGCGAGGGVRLMLSAGREKAGRVVR